MGTPWLSVVMPTYNGAAYLPAALSSILAQNDPDIEVLAVDDGSTDATLPLLESFAGRLPLRILRRDHVGNWVANTNYALALAQGQWVCFLHQDDVWLKHRLARLRSLLQQAPRASLVVHPTWYIDGAGRRLGLWRCPLPAGHEYLDASLMMERLLVQNFIALPAPTFPRETARRVGGLREDLWYTADWDFWLKLAAAGQTIYLPTPLAGFRIHPLSQTIQRSRRTDDFRSQLQAVLQDHFEAHKLLLRRRSELTEVARFSAEVNAVLAASLHGARPSWLRLSLALLRLGPAGWHRFFRDSRLTERVAARLRAGMNRRRAVPSHPEMIP